MSSPLSIQIRRQISMRSPDELKPARRNARTHSRSQLEQIAQSIRRFGFTNPVLVDEEDRILAGHGRVAAARSIGMTHIPVLCIDDLTSSERRAYALADNKLALNAGWDQELLALEMQELIDLDFELEVTGFSLAEIDMTLDAARDGSPTRDHEEKDTIPPIEGEPVSRLGDLWELDRHLLLCGDARMPEHYATLLDGRDADVVFTDPPYNVPIDGNVTGLGLVRHREFAMGSGEMTVAQFTDFLARTLGSAAQRCRSGAILFVCMDWRHMRKSTEEGLEQNFNSLDAQREACEAYVLSQAGEGWECLSDQYDDGGWSGGNMDRPALKRLLDDIKKGRIDVVVVYKVDRLTRSLMDFARIVEVFDASAVSFVSVTQAFNTTSSMGRLTLNVLLSFAQFEREVTGERIRDKIAASKARGIWMGGNIPLGYDLGDRLLVPNACEAETVRHIYQRYLELRSLPGLAKDLTAAGILTKRWVSRKGVTHGGIPFNPSGLSLILKNRIYLGEIVHRGKAHAGEHEAIIGKDLFDKVQTQLAANHHRHTTRKTRAAACPLTGKIFDADGQPMRPSFSYGRGMKMYRYYVSECLLPNGKLANGGNLQGIRLPATRIEKLLFQAIADWLAEVQGPDVIFAAVNKVVASLTQLQVTLGVDGLVSENISADMLLSRVQQQLDPRANVDGGQITFALDIPAGRKGRTIPPGIHRRSDGVDSASSADLLRTAHRKLAELDASPLELGRHNKMRAPVDAWTRDRIAIGLLAPDIQKAMLQGTLPDGTDAEALVGMDLPLDWDEQRHLLGMAA